VSDVDTESDGFSDWNAPCPEPVVGNGAVNKDGCVPFFCSLKGNRLPYFVSGSSDKRLGTADESTFEIVDCTNILGASDLAGDDGHCAG
jgi:hypothetical protein